MSCFMKSRTCTRCCPSGCFRTAVAASGGLPHTPSPVANRSIRSSAAAACVAMLRLQPPSSANSRKNAMFLKVSESWSPEKFSRWENLQRPDGEPRGFGVAGGSPAFRLNSHVRRHLRLQCRSDRLRRAFPASTKHEPAGGARCLSGRTLEQQMLHESDNDISESNVEEIMNAENLQNDLAAKAKSAPNFADVRKCPEMSGLGRLSQLEGSSLNENQVLAIRMLVTGKSLKAIANKLEVDQRTIHRWRQNETFRREARPSLAARCWSEATDRLRTLAHSLARRPRTGTARRLRPRQIPRGQRPALRQCEPAENRRHWKPGMWMSRRRNLKNKSEIRKTKSKTNGKFQ